MRLLRISLVFAILLSALAACKSATSTPSQGSVSIPGVGQPEAGKETPGQGVTATLTPQTPYPPPETPTEEAKKTPYPAPLTGETLLSERCTACHGLERITSAKQDADGWKATVDRMISKGAVLTAEEAQVLVEYLAEKYK